MYNIKKKKSLYIYAFICIYSIAIKRYTVVVRLVAEVSGTKKRRDLEHRVNIGVLSLVFEVDK